VDTLHQLEPAKPN